LGDIRGYKTLRIEVIQRSGVRRGYNTGICTGSFVMSGAPCLSDRRQMAILVVLCLEKGIVEGDSVNL